MRFQKAFETHTKQHDTKRWLGSCDICDTCGGDISEGKVFVDAMLPYRGHWGLVCETCAHLEGVRIGDGRGQMYLVTTKRKLIQG